MGPPEGSNVCTCVESWSQENSIICTGAVSRAKEVGKGSLMRVTVACPKGRAKETESPHGVDLRCCTATAWWSEPWRCWLCPVFKDEHWFGTAECSRVTLSRQCMYSSCQRGYLFGEMVTYSPAKREVPGSTRPAMAVGHCYIMPMGWLRRLRTAWYPKFRARTK